MALSEGLPDLLELWHLTVLALVQGVTEFLPISSSAHLILMPRLAGWEDQGLGLDAAMHIGTLAAVMLYFRRDVADLLAGTGDLFHRRTTPRGRLAGQIVLATLPVIVAGFLLRDLIASDFRNPAIIAFTTAAFGLLLWASDRRAGEAAGTVVSLTWRMALAIGLAQAVALVPGVSRSGITMTAALFLGLTRSESARFSLLLSIPTTAAAGALGLLELTGVDETARVSSALIAGALSFVFALLAIGALMRWLRSASFTPFVLYRLALAALLGFMLFRGLL